MEKKKKIQWRKLLIEITDSVAENEIVFQGQRFRFQYVGYRISRLGYLIIWEISTNRAIQMSRLKIPTNKQFIDIDDDKEQHEKIPSQLVFEEM